MRKKSNPTKLSPRQLEITRLLVFGYSSRQIMQKLGIRAATLVTGWSFCTKASERVYITASGCEIEFGETRGL